MRFQPITTVSVTKEFPTNKDLNQVSPGKKEELSLAQMKREGIMYKTGVYFPKKQPKSRIFYREARPGSRKIVKTTVFLLHGEKYDSRMWISIGTLHVLAKDGYRVIAVDLPGYGESTDTVEPPTAVERSRLLAAMMLKLSPNTDRILVSPSKSGIYSVPMVMSVASLLKGVVFIAPHFTAKYPTSRYEKLSLPTLVLFGEDDSTTLHVSSLDSLEHLANKKIYALPNANHDCYVDQPETFHRLLKRFLLQGTGRKA